MGLDRHGLDFLTLAKGRGVDFSRTLTLGRQKLELSPADLRLFLKSRGGPAPEKAPRLLSLSGYCEELLRSAFGAQQVSSLDASSYEGATFVKDMNLPFKLKEKFTAVLDLGCMEHVFNFPVAVDNILRLCAKDGHILHLLPGNNFCGHGFYQFSPELFYSLYSPERGFQGTSVFLVGLDRPGRWFEVRPPAQLKGRVNLINLSETYVLCLTQRTAKAVSPLKNPPQQSDYEQVAWKAPLSPAGRPHPAASLLKSLGLWAWAKSLKYRLSPSRRDLKVLDPRDFYPRKPLRVPAFLALLAAFMLALAGEFLYFNRVYGLVRTAPAPGYDLVVMYGGMEPARKGVDWALSGRTPLFISGDSRGILRGLPPMPSSTPLWLDPTPRTTDQNARMTAPFIRQRGYKRILLLTEWFHMPRALFLSKLYLAGSGVTLIPCAGEPVPDHWWTRPEAQKQLLKFWGSLGRVFLHQVGVDDWPKPQWMPTWWRHHA